MNLARQISDAAGAQLALLAAEVRELQARRAIETAADAEELERAFSLWEHAWATLEVAKDRAAQACMTLKEGL